MSTLPRLALALAVAAGAAACTPTCLPGGPQVQENLTTGKAVFLTPSDPRDGHCVAAPDGRRLRSEVDKAHGAAVHWLDARMEWTGGGWSYWVDAVDTGSGQSLPLGPAHRRTGDCSRIFGWGCDHQEEVGARIPDDLLRSRAAAGEDLVVRFVRKHGWNEGARLPAAGIKAHLDAIDAWKAARPAKQ